MYYNNDIMKFEFHAFDANTRLNKKKTTWKHKNFILSKLK